MAATNLHVHVRKVKGHFTSEYSPVVIRVIACEIVLKNFHNIKHIEVLQLK